MEIKNIENEFCGDLYQQEDLEGIVKEYREVFLKRKGSTFFVTGVTGLIGSQVVKVLLCSNRLLQTEYKIIGLARNMNKVKELFEALLERTEFSVYIGDLSEIPEMKSEIDYIIHTASITASKEMIEKPVDVIKTSVMGTDYILSLAREQKCKGVVYLSSMEAYGKLENFYASEKDLGYLDLNNIRSCYPESKRLCEILCKSYAVQYGVNVKSIRLAQTFGPGILKTDNRVFVQFAKSVINNSDIVLHTKGLSEGNYCYLKDALKAIFLILFQGVSGETYNVSNEDNHMTIAEMAQLVAKEVADNQIRVVFDIPDNLSKMGYAPDIKLKLNTEKVRALGWKPEVLLRDMYIRTIKSMRMNDLH